MAGRQAGRRGGRCAVSRSTAQAGRGGETGRAGGRASRVECEGGEGEEGAGARQRGAQAASEILTINCCYSSSLGRSRNRSSPSSDPLLAVRRAQVNVILPPRRAKRKLLSCGPLGSALPTPSSSPNHSERPASGTTHCSRSYRPNQLLHFARTARPKLCLLATNIINRLCCCYSVLSSAQLAGSLFSTRLDDSPSPSPSSPCSGQQLTFHGLTLRYSFAHDADDCDDDYSDESHTTSSRYLSVSCPP